MSKRGRKAGRVKGLSERRIAAFEAALRGRPWSSAADLTDIFDINVCAVRTLLERMHVAGLIARAKIRSLKGGPDIRVYALPGAPGPDRASAPELPEGGEPSAALRDERAADKSAPPAPHRRADGVLVCPPGCAFGYHFYQVTARGRMHTSIYQVEAGWQE